MRPMARYLRTTSYCLDAPLPLPRKSSWRCCISVSNRDAVRSCERLCYANCGYFNAYGLSKQLWLVTGGLVNEQLSLTFQVCRIKRAPEIFLHGIVSRTLYQVCCFTAPSSGSPVGLERCRLPR